MDGYPAFYDNAFQIFYSFYDNAFFYLDKSAGQRQRLLLTLPTFAKPHGRRPSCDTVVILM